jgi:hypothetical protein
MAAVGLGTWANRLAPVVVACAARFRDGANRLTDLAPESAAAQTAAQLHRDQWLASCKTIATAFRDLFLGDGYGEVVAGPLREAGFSVLADAAPPGSPTVSPNDLGSAAAAAIAEEFRARRQAVEQAIFAIAKTAKASFEDPIFSGSEGVAPELQAMLWSAKSALGEIAAMRTADTGPVYLPCGALRRELEALDGNHREADVAAGEIVDTTQSSSPPAVDTAPRLVAEPAAPFVPSPVAEPVPSPEPTSPAAVAEPRPPAPPTDEPVAPAAPVTEEGDEYVAFQPKLAERGSAEVQTEVPNRPVSQELDSIGAVDGSGDSGTGGIAAGGASSDGATQGEPSSWVPVTVSDLDSMVDSSGDSGTDSVAAAGGMPAAGPTQGDAPPDPAGAPAQVSSSEPADAAPDGKDRPKKGPEKGRSLTRLTEKLFKRKDKVKQKDQKDPYEPDSGITMPYEFEHKVHVKSDLSGLPKEWVALLRANGIEVSSESGVKPELIGALIEFNTKLVMGEQLVSSKRYSQTGTVRKLSRDMADELAAAGGDVPTSARPIAASLKEVTLADLVSPDNPEKRYKDLQEIGEGGVAKVFKARDKKLAKTAENNSAMVAIKKMNLNHKALKVVSLTEEIATMREVRFPCLLTSAPSSTNKFSPSATTQTSSNISTRIWWVTKRRTPTTPRELSGSSWSTWALVLSPTVRSSLLFDLLLRKCADFVRSFETVPGSSTYRVTRCVGCPLDASGTASFAQHEQNSSRVCFFGGFLSCPMQLTHAFYSLSIKSDNILINDTGQIKIGDFGFACELTLQKKGTRVSKGGLLLLLC